MTDFVTQNVPIRPWSRPVGPLFGVPRGLRKCSYPHPQTAESTTDPCYEMVCGLWITYRRKALPQNFRKGGVRQEIQYRRGGLGSEIVHAEVAGCFFERKRVRARARVESINAYVERYAEHPQLPQHPQTRMRQGFLDCGSCAEVAQLPQPRLAEDSV